MFPWVALVGLDLCWESLSTSQLGTEQYLLGDALRGLAEPGSPARHLRLPSTLGTQILCHPLMSSLWVLHLYPLFTGLVGVQIPKATHMSPTCTWPPPSSPAASTPSSLAHQPGSFLFKLMYWVFPISQALDQDRSVGDTSPPLPSNTCLMSKEVKQL